MFTSRSTNSYMRVLRSVTLQPIAWPSRTLKVAIDLRALVITAFRLLALVGGFALGSLAALRGLLRLLGLVALFRLLALRSLRLVGLRGLLVSISHRSRLPSAWRSGFFCGRGLRRRI